jgi:hypothetical protein
MPYSVVSKKTGSTYFLYAKQSGTRTLHYFGKQKDSLKEGEKVLDDLPTGYTVVESEQTGLPLLKKQ